MRYKFRIVSTILFVMIMSLFVMSLVSAATYSVNESLSRRDQKTF